MRDRADGSDEPVISVQESDNAYGAACAALRITNLLALAGAAPAGADTIAGSLAPSK